MKERLKTGQTAECDDCGYSAVIDTEVIEILGYRVAYGPGGPEDQFIEKADGGVTCYDCVEKRVGDIE